MVLLPPLILLAPSLRPPLTVRSIRHRSQTVPPPSRLPPPHAASYRPCSGRPGSIARCSFTFLLSRQFWRRSFSPFVCADSAWLSRFPLRQSRLYSCFTLQVAEAAAQRHLRRLLRVLLPAHTPSMSPPRPATCRTPRRSLSSSTDPYCQFIGAPPGNFQYGSVDDESERRGVRQVAG